MSRHAFPWLRPCLLAAVLAAGVGVASAHTSVGIGLNFGFPAYGSVVAGLPHGAVSVNIGGGRHWHHGGVWYRGYGPRYRIVAAPLAYGYYQGYPGYPAPLYVAPPPVVVAEAPAVSVGPKKPDPVIYPRNGQDSQQTEYDRQECNRWATTQQAAMADAGVFQRAVEACMDGRGYSMR